MSRIFLVIVFLCSMLNISAQSIDTYVPVTDLVNDNTIVLIISNEHYQLEEAVPYAINDGYVFKLYCEKTLGIPEHHIKFVEDATLGMMMRNLVWLEKSMNVKGGEAKAIFYYSGHGMPDDATKQAFLLPVDGESTEPSTGFSTAKLYERLGKMPSKGTIVLLDACFSGANRNGGMLSSSRGVAIKAKNEGLKGNLVLLSAAQGNQTALPYNSMEHGLFTYFLLEELNKKKGFVSLGELSDNVIKKVKEASLREHDKVQEPSVAATPESADWRNWKFAVGPAKQYVNLPKAVLSKSATTQPSSNVAGNKSHKIEMTGSGAYSLAGVIYEMVQVDGGSFVMGSNENDKYSTFSMNKPAHKVSLKTYAIGKTEVSQELWEAVMGSNPSAYQDKKAPVENVTWDDCQEFLRRLNSMCGTNFRLPTEAEWEYAANGRNDAMNATYNGTTHVEAVAHRGSKPAKCGSKREGALGLYDMCGNVAEWCQDYYGSYKNIIQENPIGPSFGYQRVIRGGSYEDSPKVMINYQRGHMKPTESSPTVGLRLVHELK